MRPLITAICVDNGENLLERCLQSLRQMTVPMEIIVASGPKTDIALAKRYADLVLDPVAGIGQARVQAILEASTPYILSCDSDTVYDSKYAEVACQDLKTLIAVRAGSILPLEGSPMAWVETATQLAFAYEFSLAFRRQAFLDAGIHELDYSHPKNDIGREVLVRLLPFPDPRMRCWTRFPTYHAELAAPYLPIALAGLAPLTASAGVALANEIDKTLKNMGLTFPS